MANTVNFYLATFDVNPLSDTDIKLTPTASFPRAEQDFIITNDRVLSQSNAGGTASFVNVAGGYYNVEIDGPFTATKFMLFVPTGSNTYNANSLLVNSTSLNFTNSYFSSQFSVSASYANTASFSVTASHSVNSLTASHAVNGLSASYAVTSSFSNNAESKLPLSGGTLLGDLTISASNLYLTGGFIEAGFVFSHYKDTSTNTAPVSTEVYHNTTTGTPSNGNGVSLDFSMDDSTTARQIGTRLSSTWVTASHDGRTSRYALSLVNSGSFREAFNITPLAATFTGSVTANAFSGSHFGTSSIAVSSSFALTGPFTTLVTASTYQITASNAITSSHSVTSFNAVSASSVPNVQQRILLSKFLPATTQSYVDLGTWHVTNGPHCFIIGAVVGTGGFSVSKTYLLNSQFGSNTTSLYASSSWRTVMPITSTGPFGSEDFILEAMQFSNSMSLRLVKNAGTSVGTVVLDMVNIGTSNADWVAASTTGSTTGSTEVWPSSFVTMQARVVTVSGSMAVSQSISAGAFSGSHFGTSSFAVTASTLNPVQSSSFGPSTQTTQSGWLPVNVGGTLRYLPLYS